MPSSAPPAAGVDLDRIVTEDTPGLGHNSGRVRGHRVPNLRWRAITIGSLRRHPRYRALPPESAVLLEATNPRDADDATLPFVRQHTPAWEAAREGRITTGTLALALGLWCSESAMGALNLPAPGASPATRSARSSTPPSPFGPSSPRTTEPQRARGASPRRTRTRRDSRETSGPPATTPTRRREAGRSPCRTMLKPPRPARARSLANSDANRRRPRSSRSSARVPTRAFSRLVSFPSTFRRRRRGARRRRRGDARRRRRRGDWARRRTAC